MRVFFRLLITVLAAGEADQPFCAALDHAELLDRFAGLAHDSLAQLLELRRRRGIGKERVNVIGVVEHGAGLGLLSRRGKHHAQALSLVPLRNMFQATAATATTETSEITSPSAGALSDTPIMPNRTPSIR